MSDRIANIDLDGVVYPFHTAVTRLAEHWLSNVKYPTRDAYANPLVRLPEPSEWTFWEQWGIDYEDYYKEFWPWAVEHSVFNQTVAPITGARAGLDTLREAGYEIRFVTHKPTQGGQFKHHAIRDAVQWLSWNQIEYDSIVFDGNKQRYPADLIIDDKPTREWMQEDAINIMFDQPWNQHFTDWPMYHAFAGYGWRDISTLIKHREGLARKQ